jgi:glycosyltransferase involved in cell wall biosynthesis
VVLEALAAGRPVVTTARCGAAEQILEGETGYVLQRRDDLDGMVGRLTLLLDPARRSRMGAAARQSAAGFDLGKNHEAIIELLARSAWQNRTAKPGA